MQPHFQGSDAGVRIRHRFGGWACREKIAGMMWSLGCLGVSLALAAAPKAASPAPGWLRQPLSMAEALNIALNQNAAIEKARHDLEASHGVAVQTRAIVLPQIQVTSDFTQNDPGTIERFVPVQAGEQSWDAQVQLVQSIYEGGRLISAWKQARLTGERAYLDYQTVVQDTLVQVETAYYDVLLTRELIKVRQAATDLLQHQLNDTQARFKAGTVPRFNVLRAEVELANARPPLIRARNDFRIAKQNLTNLLGYHLPPEMIEDIPLQLEGKLEAKPYSIPLDQAIQQALKHRTELASLRKAQRIRHEQIKSARAGFLPSIRLFVSYGSHNSIFSEDLTRDVTGWHAGGALSWDIFDGLLTKGKVDQAEALYRKAQTELDDMTRQVELQVRTAHSNLTEAQEVLESQRKVIDQAQEALRLAEDRFQAGTGTQLDVLSAQTALTQARSTYAQALRDYDVARVRMARAIGATAVAPKAP